VEGPCVELAGEALIRVLMIPTQAISDQSAEQTTFEIGGHLLTLYAS
jgi:hypothetical protein